MTEAPGGDVRRHQTLAVATGFLALFSIVGFALYGLPFFYDFFVPESAVVGERGSGWKLAMAVLGYERGAVDIGYQAKFERLLRELRDELDPADRDASRRVAAAAEFRR